MRVYAFKEAVLKYCSLNSNVYSCFLMLFYDVLLQKCKDIHMPNFVLNDEILTRVNKCKYIGHALTEVLSDDDDMARQYKRIYAQGNALIRKFYYI